MFYNQQYPMGPQSAMPMPVYQQACASTVSTEFYQIRPDDTVILYSLEKYLANKGYTPQNLRPDEWIRMYESSRDIFYSDIVQRLTRVIPYINYASEDDDVAKGLRHSLAHHMRNKYFIDLMMKQLYQENNPVANGFIGAFLCKAVEIYINEMHAKDELEVTEVKSTKKDKDKDKDKVEPPKKSNVDDSIIAMMYNAAKALLSDKYVYVKNQCLNIGDGDALAIAAYLAMNNELTVKELIRSDLPITADLLQNDVTIGKDPGNIISAALKLQKADYAKLSVNQTKFVDSLVTWIYERLDALQPTACLEYLVCVYGTSQPADVVKPYLIQLKDCSTKYPQLKQVTRALKIN